MKCTRAAIPATRDEVVAAIYAAGWCVVEGYAPGVRIRTHETCRGCDRCDYRGGHLRQIVDAATLRRQLRRDGETLDRPDDFGPLDEWEVL